MPHGSDATGSRNPEETIRLTTYITPPISKHILLVLDSRWAGPQEWRAGPYKARVSLASLPVSWAGPDRARPGWAVKC